MSSHFRIYIANNKLKYTNSPPNTQCSLHYQCRKQHPYLASKDDTFPIFEELVICSLFGTKSEYFGFSRSHSCNYKRMSLLYDILMVKTKQNTYTIYYPQSMAGLILVALIGIANSESH
jgi:hypothetical protein